MAKHKTEKLKVLFAGGGSGGPVVPLMAVAEEIKKLKPDAKFLLVGTSSGPEQLIAQRQGIAFKSIQAGRLRRYLSIKNLLSPFQVAIGFAQSLKLVKQFKPDVAVGAGGFVQVPVLYAAKFLKVPVVIHQQDVEPSFANTLCAPIATKITVSFDHSVKSFFQGSGLLSAHKQQKIVFTGNAFRESLAHADKAEALKFFGLKAEWPTLLVLGGGTGARFINQLVADNVNELGKIAQIIHFTGKGKMVPVKHPNYHPYEFTDRIDLAYAAADIVVTRAGLSTLTELSNLGKVTIIIPIPDTHQEANAAVFWYKKAAIVIDQKNFDPKKLAPLIHKLLFKLDIQKSLISNIKKIMPRGAGQKLAEIILKEANHGPQ